MNQPQELLNKSKKSPVVAFHRFVLGHRRFKTDLFCFYEGKDTHYYYPRIKSFFGENHHPIVCGNKKSVIKTYEFIKAKYPNYKTAFFVDSDFDDKVHQKDIYNTPCYSIENLYCTKNVLEQILKNEFLLKETDSTFREIIDIFNFNKKQHNKATSLFNIWYASIKNKAKLNQTSINVSLDDKFPKEFITIKIGEIKSNYDLAKIKSKFPKSIDITEKDIKKTQQGFYTIPPELKHRGKYELEFFIALLKYLIDDCNNHQTIIKKRTKFNIDKSQVLSQLSQYSETPDCLIQYINNYA